LGATLLIISLIYVDKRIKRMTVILVTQV